MSMILLDAPPSWCTSRTWRSVPDCPPSCLRRGSLRPCALSAAVSAQADGCARTSTLLVAGTALRAGRMLMNWFPRRSGQPGPSRPSWMKHRRRKRRQTGGCYQPAYNQSSADWPSSGETRSWYTSAWLRRTCRWHVLLHCSCDCRLDSAETACLGTARRQEISDRE